MDCNRLPLAHDSNILYMYKHPNAIKHVQSIYDADYTINPRSVIKPVMPREKIIANKKKEINEKLSVSSLIIVEEPVNETVQNIVEIVSEPETESELDNKENVDPVKVVETIVEQKQEIAKVAPIDAWMFMVSHIDDTSSLYTANMWRDAIDSMKQKLIVLMTSGAGHKKYGPKKSRTILAWLTDNKRGTPASAETALVIADFISWLVDVKVSSIETEKTNASWIMFRKRGVWMIRINV